VHAVRSVVQPRPFLSSLLCVAHSCSASRRSIVPALRVSASLRLCGEPRPPFQRRSLRGELVQPDPLSFPIGHNKLTIGCHSEPLRQATHRERAEQRAAIIVEQDPALDDIPKGHTAIGQDEQASHIHRICAGGAAGETQLTARGITAQPFVIGLIDEEKATRIGDGARRLRISRGFGRLPAYRQPACRGP